MILKHYIDEVALKLQITDETEKLTLKDYINKAINKIFEMYPELLYAETTSDTVASEHEIDLPSAFWKPVALTIGDIKMKKVGEWDFTGLRPNPADDDEDRPEYYNIKGINTSSMAITDTLEIISSSASDTMNFSIYGDKSDGTLLNQTIALNGTTAVALDVDFNTIFYISIPQTAVGDIDLRYVTDSSVLKRLYVGTVNADFISFKNILRVYPYPDDVYTIRIKYFKNVPQLKNEGDYLEYLKPVFDNVLIERAYIQYLYYNGQENLAIQMESKWIAEATEKINTEKRLDRQDSQKEFGFQINSTRDQFDPLGRWN